MPLVTRTSAQSTVYAQATSPTITQDGETWVDTDTGAVYTSENGSWVPQSVGAIGTARQQLAVNSGATALEYVTSMQSLLTAQGDIIYASAANTPARLAKGTAAQVLKMNSGATAPEWGNTGTYEYLTTYTAAQAEATYTYTPASALTFANYSAIIIEIDGEITAALSLRLRINGGVTAGNYKSQGMTTDGSTVAALDDGGSQTSYALASSSLLNTANDQFLGQAEIRMGNTTTQRAVVFARICEPSGGTKTEITSGYIIGATEITSITILTSTSTWLTGTRFSIYGVKRS